MFDEITIQRLKYYVYALVNPKDNMPFYIGKGVGNRVFEHQNLSIKEKGDSLKLDFIKSLAESDVLINHVIIRHGLDEKEAFEVEASLIDFSNRFQFNLLNKVEGHHSSERGLMISDEVQRMYSAEKLLSITDPVIIININKKFSRGSSVEEIYNATKEAWVISKTRTEEVKYALSEFKGIIIEVFEIEEWYSLSQDELDKNIVPDFLPKKKESRRWGFNGIIANKKIRDKYINKSIGHVKKRGSANPIRYSI